MGGFFLKKPDGTLLDSGPIRPKALALLKLLSLQPEGRLQRDGVLAALWPELSATAAGANLRKVRYHLRSALDAFQVTGEFIELGDGCVSFRAEVTTDVDDFLRAAKAAQVARTDTTLYELAISLYGGELLPEDRFQEWTEPRRSQLRGLQQQLLMEAALLHETTGSLGVAIAHAQQLVEADPANEESQRLLMRLHAESGRRDLAIQQYQNCREALRELGATPEDATEALLQRIRAGQVSRLPAGSKPATTLVGREPESAQLRTLVEAALGGSGQVVLIAGEPGIGKTALAEELAVYAKLRRMRVVWGRCYEDESLPAFGPWVQVVRGCARGQNFVDDGSLAPLLNAKAPRYALSEMADPEPRRDRLFEAMANFLAISARREPLLVIVDDLQWADDDSMQLLLYLARSLSNERMLFAATFREGDAAPSTSLSEMVTVLARERHCRLMLLDGLDERAVRALVHTSVGEGAPDQFVQAIYERTQGNPFYLTETLRMLAAERAESAKTDESWKTPLPSRAQEAILGRLSLLSPQCRRVLDVASVAGQEFNLSLMERVLELDRSKVLELLDEATRAQIVREHASYVGRFVFAHPLFREALYEALAPGIRTSYHRSIATAVEALYEGDLDEHLSELAHHYYKAAAGGETRKAIEYAERAGDQAFESAAYAEAARLYRCALQVLETALPIDRAKRVLLRIALGRACWRLSQTAEAAELYRAAVDESRAVGDPRLFARAAYFYSSTRVTSMSVDESLVHLLEDALQRLGSQHKDLKCLILGEIAKRLEGAPSNERAVAAGREAIRIARDLNDDVLLGRSLRDWYDSAWSPDNLEERLAAADELIRAGLKSGDEAHVLNGRIRRIAALVEYGDRAAFDLELAKLNVPATKARTAGQERWVAVMQTLRALLIGDFSESERLALKALELGQKVRDPDAPAIYGGQLLQLRWDQGRIGEMEGPLRDALRHNPSFYPFRASLAHVLVEAGRTDEACYEFHAIVADGLGALPRNRVWVVTLLLLSQVATHLNDVERANELYVLLLPYADRCGVVSTAHACTGSNHRVLGLLASLLGRLGDAQRHFEQAIAVNERLGALPYLARTQAEYARMLQRRSGPGDAELAAGLHQRARLLGERLGMALPGERRAAKLSQTHAESLAGHA